MARLELHAHKSSYTNGIRIVSIRNIAAATRTELAQIMAAAAPQFLAEIADSKGVWNRLHIAAGHRVKGRFIEVMRVAHEINA